MTKIYDGIGKTDVADYLESVGYRILKANSEGKKKRLAVVTEKSSVIRMALR